MSNLLECAQTGDADTARALVEGILSGVFPPAFTVTVVAAPLTPTRMAVSFWVKDGRESVMYSTRIIDAARKVTTDHGVRVATAYQGRGYTAASTQAMEAAYAACGITEINILANGAGAYAWAKANYLFATDADAFQTVQAVQRRTEDPALVAQCSTWLSDGPLPTPREIAEFGDTAGRDALLNTVWRGVKHL